MKITTNIIILSLLLQSFAGFSQSDFNKVDENGKKNGLWKGFFTASKRLRFQGNFDHGIEIGVFDFYDDSAEHTIIATRTFSKNGTVAENVFMDKKGNIISKGTTVNRLNEGQWVYYHIGTTEVKMIEIYKKGKLEGVKKIFYKNNILAEETQYTNGLKNGPSRILLENGIVIEEVFYKNNEYNGLAIFREGNGKIASQGKFVDGAKKGKWQFFENGKLKKEIIMPEKIKFSTAKDKKSE